MTNSHFYQEHLILDYQKDYLKKRLEAGPENWGKLRCLIFVVVQQTTYTYDELRQLEIFCLGCLGNQCLEPLHVCPAKTNPISFA